MSKLLFLNLIIYLQFSCLTSYASKGNLVKNKIIEDNPYNLGIINLQNSYSLASISNIQLVERNDSIIIIIPNTEYSKLDIYGAKFSSHSEYKFEKIYCNFLYGIEIPDGFCDFYFCNNNLDSIIFINNELDHSIIHAKIVKRKIFGKQKICNVNFKNPIYGDRLSNQIFEGKLYLTNFTFNQNNTVDFTFYEITLKTLKRKNLFNYQALFQNTYFYPFVENINYLIDNENYYFFWGYEEYINIVNRKNLSVKKIDYDSGNFLKVVGILPQNYDFGTTTEYIHSNSIYVNYYIYNKKSEINLVRFLKHKNSKFTEKSLKVIPYYHCDWSIIFINPVNKKIKTFDIPMASSTSPIGSTTFKDFVLFNLNKDLVSNKKTQINNNDTIKFRYEKF